MEKFTILNAKTVPLPNDNIDTDQIIPKQFLKAITKTGFGKHLFYEWQADKTFVLNDPKYKDAQILVTGDNFGSGSSREHAAWALGDYGFKVIIAGSFSDIFYNNALKNRLLPITLPLDVRQKLYALSHDEEITVDLPNQLIKTSVGDFNFDIDETNKHKLVNGLDEIGITLTFEDEIAKYEADKKLR